MQKFRKNFDPKILQRPDTETTRPDFKNLIWIVTIFQKP